MISKLINTKISTIKLFLFIFLMNPLKKIVVTGCNKGIGAKIVQNLASKQHNHLIMACRNVSAAQQTSNNFENKSSHSQVDVCQIDLQNGASIKAFTENIKKKYNKIDVLVNNAGITCPMTSKSEQDTRTVLETNFYSTVQLTEQLLDNINQNGKIIFAGGFVGKFSQLSNQQLKGKLKGCQTKNDLFELVKQYQHNFKEGNHIKNGWPKWSYALSKLAINIYAKILSKHPTVTSNRIQVYSYCPGYVKTDMTGNKGKLTPAEGATTPVFLAQLDPSQYKPEQNGGFFQKCKLSSLD